METEIARGAEAVLLREGDELVKRRLRKGYRIPELDDRLRRQRTRLEAGLLGTARRAGIATPRVLETTATDIRMEFIGGERVRELLPTLQREARLGLYRKIGDAVGRLHAAGIMHGDLTTSNMLLRDGRLHLIDFGLARPSRRVEDQAVDLFLLHEALKAGHFPLLEEAWPQIIAAYRDAALAPADVLRAMERIERRRRYRGE